MKFILEIGEVYEALRQTAEKKSGKKFSEDDCVLYVEDGGGNEIEIADVQYICEVSD